MSDDLLIQHDKKAMELEKLRAELALSDNMLFLVVELVGAGCAAFRRWRERRRTRRALAELSDQQLRDIGLERSHIVLVPSIWSWPDEKSYRALARLDDCQTEKLSAVGRTLRKEAQRKRSLG